MGAVRHNQAISAALTLASSPALVNVMRRHPLPDDVIDLLHAFSGDEDVIRDALSWCGRSELHVMAAIEHYVQEVIAYQGASAVRTLGLRDGYDRDIMRLHLKLLLKGCHPDQSGDPWRVVYASRVIEAWRSLSGSQDVPHIEPAKNRRGSVGHLSFIRHHHDAQKRSIVQRIADRLNGLIGRKTVKSRRLM